MDASSDFAPGTTALLTSTLLGKLARHDISYDDQQKLHVNTTWTAEVQSLAKVNGIALNDKYLAVGGITKDGKGSVEIWSRPDECVSAEQMSRLSL